MVCSGGALAIASWRSGGKTPSAVVLAKAGTHNHRGYNCARCFRNWPASPVPPAPACMGPGLRRDDVERDTHSTPPPLVVRPRPQHARRSPFARGGGAFLLDQGIGLVDRVLHLCG